MRCTNLTVPLFWGRGYQSACSGIIFGGLNSLTRHTAHETIHVLCWVMETKPRAYVLGGFEEQSYLRHIRDDKLLSSLPPLSLEKGRCTSLDWACPTDASADEEIGCGHRHSAALRRLQCMRDLCMFFSVKAPDTGVFNPAAEHESGRRLMTLQYTLHRDDTAFARLASKHSAIELSLTLL